MEAVAHDARPQPARRPVLRHLLEQVVVSVKKNDSCGAKSSRPGQRQRRFDVRGWRWEQREGDFLRGRRPASRMWYPEIEIVFQRGTRSLQ